MEVSTEIKEEIRKTQSDLKNAIKVHQSWVARLKDNGNNEGIRARIREAEKEIVNIGQIQRKVIDRLRQELELYQQKLKTRNKQVNIEYENKYIAQQLREYQLQKKTRKKSISLLKPSVLNEILLSSDSNVVNGYKNGNGNKSEENNQNGEGGYRSDVLYSSKRGKDVDEDTEFIKATENFSLKDPAITIQDRRANFANALNKAKQVICPPQDESFKRSPSPKSESSLSPSHVEEDSSTSTPSPSPPGAPDTKEGFLRLLGLITPHHRQLLEKKRNERKKRSTTSTNRNEFVYGNFDVQMVTKKRRLNFPYLQQNIPPPTTRSQQQHQQRKQQRNTTASSPPESPLGFSIPSGLTIIPVSSPEPMPCCICHHNDVPSLLRQCSSCSVYYHWSCARRSPSPSQDSSSSTASPPGCPQCGELPREQRNSGHTLSMTVIASGSSNRNVEHIIQEKLAEKRLLQERNQQLRADLKKLEIRAETLKENIEEKNVTKKRLLSEQIETQKTLQKLLEFVSHFKDTPLTVGRKVEPTSDTEDSS